MYKKIIFALSFFSIFNNFCVDSKRKREEANLEVPVTKRVKLEYPKTLFDYFKLEDRRLLDSSIKDNSLDNIEKLCLSNLSLHKAVVKGDLEAVEWILKHTKYAVMSEDVSDDDFYIDYICEDDSNIFGYPPLGLAIYGNFIEIAKLLLQYEADINIQFWPDGPEGHVTTPLIIAIEENNIEMVNLILNNGAIVNEIEEEDSVHYQPLNYALDLQDIKPEIIMILIDKGADVNQEGPEGYPFDIVFDNGEEGAEDNYDNLNYDLISILIKNNTTVCKDENIAYWFLFKELENLKKEDYKEFFSSLNEDLLNRAFYYIIRTKKLDILKNMDFSILNISEKEKDLAKFLYKFYTDKDYRVSEFRALWSGDYPVYNRIRELNLTSLARDIRLNALLSAKTNMPPELTEHIVDYIV